MRLGGIVDKPAAWKKRGRPRLLAVEDPQVLSIYPSHHARMRSVLHCLQRQPTDRLPFTTHTQAELCSDEFAGMTFNPRWKLLSFLLTCLASAFPACHASASHARYWEFRSRGGTSGPAASTSSPSPRRSRRPLTCWLARCGRRARCRRQAEKRSHGQPSRRASCQLQCTADIV